MNTMKSPVDRWTATFIISGIIGAVYHILSPNTEILSPNQEQILLGVFGTLLVIGGLRLLLINIRPVLEENISAPTIQDNFSDTGINDPQDNASDRVNDIHLTVSMFEREETRRWLGNNFERYKSEIRGMDQETSHEFLQIKIDEAKERDKRQKEFRKSARKIIDKSDTSDD